MIALFIVSALTLLAAIYAALTQIKTGYENIK